MKYKSAYFIVFFLVLIAFVVLLFTYNSKTGTNLLSDLYKTALRETGLDNSVYYRSESGSYLSDIHVTDLDPPTVGTYGTVTSFDLERNPESGEYELFIALEVEDKVLQVEIPYFSTNKIGDMYVISKISDEQAEHIRDVLIQNQTGIRRPSRAVLDLIALNSSDDREKCLQRVGEEFADWCVYDRKVRKKYDREDLLKMVKSNLQNPKFAREGYHTFPDNVQAGLFISFVPVEQEE